MVAWALQIRGVASIWSVRIMFSRTPRIRSPKNYCRRKAGSLCAERYTPLGGQNLDEIVREIAALRPDFVLNTLNGDSNLYFFRALKQAGVAPKLSRYFQPASPRRSWAR